MINSCSIEGRQHLICSGLALNRAGRFQSIRAKQRTPATCSGALVSPLLLTRRDPDRSMRRWVPVLEGVRVQVTTLSRA